jgi:ribosomal protein S4E
MRIPDEKQLFQIGEEVFLVSGDSEKSTSSPVGIIDAVISHSVYYEHRPIATYLQYTYVVKIADEKVYLKADKLMSAK